jgi:DnaK suppressor protein
VFVVAKSNKTAGSGRKGLGKPTAKKSARPVVQQTRPGGKSALPPAAKPFKMRKTYLSRKELAEFREILLSKRRTLAGDLHGMREDASGQDNAGNLSSMPTHMADVGTDNFEHEFTLGLLESEQALLREINEAIARIDDSTYGICLGTGEPIPKARLKAKPWAKYTVDYARMLEKGLVRAPDGRDEDDRLEGEDEAEEEIEEEETEDVVGEEAEAGEAEVHDDDEE